MDKLCKKCLKTKPLDEFYRHQQMADGHLNKCKECTKADVNENREQNLDYYKNYDRKRYDSVGRRNVPSKEAQDKGRKRWLETHQQERRAHVMVGNAIRDGRLVRPSVCAKCHETGTVEGHHEDYSKPLTVTWLCKKCHAKTRKKEREELQPRKRGGYKGRMVASRAE